MLNMTASLYGSSLIMDEYRAYASSILPLAALSRALFAWSLNGLASTSFKAKLLSTKCGAMPLASSADAATRHWSINERADSSFGRFDPHCLFLAVVFDSFVN